MAFHRGPKIITDGLVLALDAANPKSYPGTGTTWKDLSGGGNNGTLTNGPTYNSVNKGRFTFDGTNDYVIVNSPTLNPVGNSDFSISTWVKLNSLPQVNDRIVTQGVDSNNYFNLATYGGNDPSTYSIFWFEVKKNGTLYGGFFNGPRKYETDIWYNLVGTFNNSTNAINFYINNTSVSGTGVYGGAPTSYGPIYIGKAVAFPGDIAQVQMYNKELTSNEVLQNYNATKNRFI